MRVVCGAGMERCESELVSGPMSCIPLAMLRRLGCVERPRSDESLASETEDRFDEKDGLGGGKYDSDETGTRETVSFRPGMEGTGGGFANGLDELDELDEARDGGSGGSKCGGGGVTRPKKSTGDDREESMGGDGGAEKENVLFVVAR